MTESQFERERHWAFVSTVCVCIWGRERERETDRKAEKDIERLELGIESQIYEFANPETDPGSASQSVIR